MAPPGSAWYKAGQLGLDIFQKLWNTRSASLVDRGSGESPGFSTVQDFNKATAEHSPVAQSTADGSTSSAPRCEGFFRKSPTSSVNLRLRRVEFTHLDILCEESHDHLECLPEKKKSALNCYRVRSTY